MKKQFGVLWLSLLLVALTPTGARAQFGQSNRRDADRVCFYTDNYFQGTEQCYRPGDEVSNLQSRNFSSIRVYGNAMVTVYDGANFRGNAMDVTSEIRDLAQVLLEAGGFGGLGGRGTWNDRIDSFRVTSSNYNRSRDDRYNNGRYDNGRYNNGRFGRTSGSVCVYEGANYTGRMECFDSGVDVSDLGRSGSWNDRISSIRLNGNARAVAYLDVGYGGERLVINQDIPDLRNFRLRNSNRSWDKQISSLEIGGQSFNNGRSYTTPNRRY